MKSVSNLSVKSKTMIIGMASLLAIVVASVTVYVMHTPHDTSSSGLRLWNARPDDIVTEPIHQNLKGNELNTVPLGVGKRKVSRRSTRLMHISMSIE